MPITASSGSAAFAKARPDLDGLIKRRFFYRQAFEIYGGVAGFYTYGPPGAAVKQNLLALWRKHFVIEENLMEVDDTNIMPHDVLFTSGHVERFNDFIVKDSSDANRFWRADKLLEEVMEAKMADKACTPEQKVEYQKVHAQADAYSAEQLSQVFAQYGIKARGTAARSPPPPHPLPAQSHLRHVFAPSALHCRRAHPHCRRPRRRPRRRRPRRRLPRRRPPSPPPLQAPESGAELTPPEEFNLMFATPIGPSGMIQGYLRPETAQGIFLNFKFCLEQNNYAMPFGIAQVGKAFRNEIAPRSGLIRQREFTQAEIEYFVHPQKKAHPKFAAVGSLQLELLPSPQQLAAQPAVRMSLAEAVAAGTVANETLGFFIGRTYQFLVRAGCKAEHIRFRQHLPDEMAHYACDCWDAEIEMSLGWVECVGG